MSSTLPPPPPPPSGPSGGPPGPPPSGPPEFLESGGGAPAPREPRADGSPAKKGLLVGGGVLGLAAVGVGAWAAYGFFSTGPQPAEALPAATLGYASIDLDPSGGQKIEALKTLNKFPAFKDYVGISSDDDLRKEIFERINDEAGCDGLDYADDIEPWLGDRAAFAAVDVGGEDPDPVIVLQVKDADKADEGLDKIKDCGEGEDVGWEVEGDWAVIAESDSIAGKVVDAAAKGSLADDEDFQKWTDEAGDAGVVTLYAGPAAGDYFADHADSMFGFPLGLVGDDVAASECAIPGDADLDGETPEEYCTDVEPDVSMDSQVTDDLKDKLRQFKGMAATVRFDDGAVELELAGDSTLGGQAFVTGGDSADVVASLPSDTGAVLGLGFKEGWFGDVLDYVAPYTGSSADELASELSDMTGLDLPADAETLAGDSAALVLGSDFDMDSLFSSGDTPDVPVAVKIQGDPDEIEKVLDKLRAQAGPDAGFLESDQDGDMIVVGPSSDFRAEVLKDGGLGDDEVFKDVVREADKAQMVLFVNVDEFEDAIASAAGDGDRELVDNIKPVSGFGITQWQEDGVTHAVVRLATD